MKKLLSLALALIIAAALPVAVSAEGGPVINVWCEDGGSPVAQIVSENDEVYRVRVTFNPAENMELDYVSATANVGAFEEPLMFEDEFPFAPAWIEFDAPKDCNTITVAVGFKEASGVSEGGPEINVSIEGSGSAPYEIVEETDSELTLNITFNPAEGYKLTLFSVTGKLGAFDEPVIFDEYSGYAPESLEFTVSKDYDSVNILVVYSESGASFLKGDFDGDGEITVSDALAALRIAAKLAEETDDAIRIGDVDGDGSISVNDALAILRVAAKLADPGTLG